MPFFHEEVRRLLDGGSVLRFNFFEMKRSRRFFQSSTHLQFRRQQVRQLRLWVRTSPGDCRRCVSGGGVASYSQGRHPSDLSDQFFWACPAGPYRAPVSLVGGGQKDCLFPGWPLCDCQTVHSKGYVGPGDSHSVNRRGGLVTDAFRANRCSPVRSGGSENCGAASEWKSPGFWYADTSTSNASCLGRPGNNPADPSMLFTSGLSILVWRQLLTLLKWLLAFAAWVSCWFRSRSGC